MRLTPSVLLVSSIASVIAAAAAPVDAADKTNVAETSFRAICDFNSFTWVSDDVGPYIEYVCPWELPSYQRCSRLYLDKCIGTYRKQFIPHEEGGFTQSCINLVYDHIKGQLRGSCLNKTFKERDDIMLWIDTVVHYDGAETGLLKCVNELSVPC